MEEADRTELAVLEKNLAGYRDVFSAELEDLPELAHGATEFDALFGSHSEVDELSPDVNSSKVSGVLLVRNLR